MSLRIKKKVFLTIDDGPSANTLKILDILKTNNVSATFFIIGQKAEENPGIIKELYDSGMCIASHSYSHDYKIYKSTNTYLQDLIKCIKVIVRFTGEYPVPVTRFPGGSYNYLYGKETMLEIKRELRNRGISYVDWNVSSADAASGIVPSEIIRSNIINQCKNWNVSVVLMHDSPGKKTTVEALPEVIKELKSKGYEFKTFKNISSSEREEMINLKIMNR